MKPVALYYRSMCYQPESYQRLQAIFQLIELNDPSEDTPALLKQVEVLFAPLGFMVDLNKMQHCPKLRAIVSNTTGIPHIDTQAAALLNIKICALHDEQAFLKTITPTAEHTIGLMLAVQRRIFLAHQAVVNGEWNRNHWVAPKMLSRMSLGIVGFGRLGQHVAKIAQAFGMRVAYYDPFVPGGETSLIKLAQRSEILTLHAPANAQTQHLISRAVLDALPAGAILINTARGELVDLEALLACLASGHLAGAGLDTLAGEYALNFTDSAIFKRVVQYAQKNNNLILTPHIGGSTTDARTETELFVINKVTKFLAAEVLV